MSEFVVIVVFVPSSHAEVVRDALAKAGAGQLGEYTACSFTSVGEGKFIPNANAHPYLGTANKLETVTEVRIETLCKRQKAKDAVKAMLAAHPYEEPAWHCYEALLLDDLAQF